MIMEQLFYSHTQEPLPEFIYDALRDLISFV